jgi:hypothetical protein
MHLGRRNVVLCLRGKDNKWLKKEVGDSSDNATYCSVLNFHGLPGNPSGVDCIYKSVGMYQRVVRRGMEGRGLEMVSFRTH